MTITITNLKAAMRGALARATKYKVNITVPPIVPVRSDLRNAEILCKATTFPSMSLGVIDIFIQGRKLPMPGDTSYTSTWTLTFYNTETHDIRADMIRWITSIDNFQKNTHSGDPGELMGDMSLEQVDSANNTTIRYTFHNVFPIEISELSVSAESIDTAQEFDVTFSFSDWVIGTEDVHNFSSVKSTRNVLA